MIIGNSWLIDCLPHLETTRHRVVSFEVDLLGTGTCLRHYSDLTSPCRPHKHLVCISAVAWRCGIESSRRRLRSNHDTRAELRSALSDWSAYTTFAFIACSSVFTASQISYFISPSQVGDRKGVPRHPWLGIGIRELWRVLITRPEHSPQLLAGLSNTVDALGSKPKQGTTSFEWNPLVRDLTPEQRALGLANSTPWRNTPLPAQEMLVPLSLSKTALCRPLDVIFSQGRIPNVQFRLLRLRHLHLGVCVLE